MRVIVRPLLSPAGLEFRSLWFVVEPLLGGPAGYQSYDDVLGAAGILPCQDHDHDCRDADAQSDCQGDDVARVETRARGGIRAGSAFVAATSSAGGVFLGSCSC